MIPDHRPSVGIRELRADLAARVRRAANGEPTIVSVGGRPTAALVPLAMSDEGRSATHLSSLVASGSLVPARRADRRLPNETVAVWGNVRLDRLLPRDPRLTLYLDASALVAAHLDQPSRAVVHTAMRGDAEWCTSGLTLIESLALIDRVTDDAAIRDDLEDLVRLTWDRLAVVPVDQRCLDRAAALIRARPLRLSDALHLAAADRLPRPVSFVTFDPAQIPVALALGFDVVST